MDITTLFASQLLYFHRERNQAIGVTADNQFVRGLRLFGYQVAQQETEQTFANLESTTNQAEALRMVISQSRQKVKVLISSAKTSEEKRVILPHTTKLLEIATQAGDMLKELADG